MSSLSTAMVLDPPRLEAARASRVVLAGRVAAALGVALAAAAAALEPHRFGYSYLTGFAFAVTLATGALFFVLIQHLTRAGWSVTARRQMEWVASALPVLALLFVPLAALGPHVWEWMSPEAASDELIHKKAPFLNAPFFYARALLYFAVWGAIAWYFAGASRAQDGTGDPELTRRMQVRSAPALVLFALTVTFAAFDWLMSLDPHWYSTIFGVYVFAGSVTGSLSVLALLVLALQRSGAVRTVLTVEHRHDVGKLLFGFTVFWAYIAFSQYFLIWYANIPEETIWYLHRWEGSWQTVSLSLVVLHFALPFMLLLSRAGKRSQLVLGASAVILLVAHYLDLYWLVMPTLDRHGAHFGWVDLAGVAAPLGVLAWWVTRRAANDALYPVRDPRLAEAVRLDNA